MVDERTFDVFLAHNSKDKAFVRAIAQKLEERGLVPWLDEQQIPPGRFFQDYIQQAIPQVKAAAIFFGPHGPGDWQTMEVRVLIERCVKDKLPVIPVLLPGVEQLPDDWVFLGQMSWVKFPTKANKTALNQLVWGITGEKSGPVVSGDEQKKVKALVTEARKEIIPKIKELCGKMRVLDMEQPLGINDIYTDVNVLERVTGHRTKEIIDLMHGCTSEDFERFNLGKVVEKRVPGEKAVKKHSKLMILGKPGAGKTTFLKHLALRCSSGNFQRYSVPIFITLRAFAEAAEQPSLLNYVRQYFNEKVALESIQLLLEQGRFLILLDGLDEVREEDNTRILHDIETFCADYGKNQFIITCRIAAKEYNFQNFADIEVADFTKEQIAIFSKKWFADKDPIKGQNLIRDLESNEPILELATNPLLLTLLCLVYGENGEFPAKRSELYKDGLDVLLKKWDGKRNIKREQIYKKLSLQDKENLLSNLAWTTFKQGVYFFKQEELQDNIITYIRNLPAVQNDPDALQLDSEAILKSIEAQHGLLVERASKIYSFSHLTFHEYFVAREITSNPDLQKTLAAHITEKRWREVILLTTGMLRNADSFILEIKTQVDQIVADDPKMQAFLAWAERKAKSVRAPYKLAAVRSYYCSLAIARARGRSWDLTLTRDLAIALAIALALDLARAHTVDNNLRESLEKLKHQLPDKNDQDAHLAWWDARG